MAAEDVLQMGTKSQGLC